jgi:hypothetical protein
MKTFIAGLATLLLAASPAFADLHLTMHDGRVTIVARDATVRQILIEWARIGQTKIVNVERIPGGPVTLELNNVTELRALEVLLRPLSGYIAAPRAVGAPNLSAYDRIIIMPTLAEARPIVLASASPAPAASSSPPPPVFQQAPPSPPPADDDQSNDAPPSPNVPNAAAPPEMIRSPAANTFSQGLEVGRPSMSRSPSRTPVTRSGAPLPPFSGVAVPGMIAPAPPQQGQPGQPAQTQPPAAPVPPGRRPGGP